MSFWILRTVRAELGLTLASGTIGRLDIYTWLIEGDGRGLDFVRRYDPAGIVGVRGTL